MIGATTKFRRYSIWLSPHQKDQAVALSRKLGYTTFAQFLRCLIARELRAPELPNARKLLGRNARELSLSRPRRAPND